MNEKVILPPAKIKIEYILSLKYGDLDDFLNKIVPLPNVKKYTLKFLSKCLSGENRDEGFYI